ncbi:MAG: hypothetical protein AB4050_05420 [Synechococcus sp.]
MLRTSTGETYINRGGGLRISSHPATDKFSLFHHDETYEYFTA